MTVKSISISKLHILVIPKNTFRMSKIATIYTIIKPMLGVSFFFTDITIIITRVIFNNITKSKGMLMLFVPCS